MNRQKILFVTAECAPFAKVGGLADVAASLPNALQAEGAEVRVIMPLYKKIKEKYKNDLIFIRWSMVNMGWRTVYAGLYTFTYNDIQYYFIDNEFYFSFDSVYVNYDFDLERFIFFQHAVLETMGYSMDFTPTVLHCNDWSTALIPVMLDAFYKRAGHFQELKTVFTIHNLKYQGQMDYHKFLEYCPLTAEYMNEYGVLFNHTPNCLKAALVYADFITTVSPNYAQEILNEYYGEGLSEVLKYYQFKLRGIVNGLNELEYNPATDKLLSEQYDSSNYKEVKQIHKKNIQEKLGLTVAEDIPLLSMVTRLVDQKGLDLFLHVVHEILAIPAQVIILGTGDSAYETELRALEHQYKGKLVAYIAYDNKLAHQIYAASDFFLMPSLFEPCGLSQLIAMAYGSLPIVRETGGLKDTVEPYNQYLQTGNGYSFSNINAHEFLYAIERACALYKEEPEQHAALVVRAMNKNSSWLSSAKEYHHIYWQIRPLLY